MKKFLKYKGYIGSINFDDIDKIFFGKIDNISDLITFESNDFLKIEEVFKETVDDYIELKVNLQKNY